MNDNLPISSEARIRRRKRGGARTFFAVFFALAMICGAVFLITNKDFLSKFSKKEPPENSGDAEMPKEKSIYDFDFSLVPEGFVAALPTDISKSATDFDASPVAPDIKEGSVIVLSTHPYDAYLERDVLYVDGEYIATSGEHNAGTLAKYVCEKLCALGINAKFIDTENVSARSAYANTAKKLAEHEQNDSVALVIDIGRMSEIGTHGELMRPIVSQDGEILSQIMLAVGADGEYASARAENAAYLSHKLCEMAKNVCVCGYASGALAQNTEYPYFTIYIGGSGTNVSEAEKSADLLCGAICDLIK